MICPICDSLVDKKEGLLIRPMLSNDSQFKVVHVDYSQPLNGGTVIHYGYYSQLSIN